MFEHLDPRSPEPLYAQIAHRLRIAIAAGELRVGQGLPSVRQLAAELRLNPATIAQAYRQLEEEGLVQMKQGAGTFVSDVAPERRARERAAEARRLVRALLGDAARRGISRREIATAINAELNGKGS